MYLLLIYNLKPKTNSFMRLFYMQITLHSSQSRKKEKQLQNLERVFPVALGQRCKFANAIWSKCRNIVTLSARHTAQQKHGRQQGSSPPDPPPPTIPTFTFFFLYFFVDGSLGWLLVVDTKARMNWIMNPTVCQTWYKHNSTCVRVCASVCVRTCS